MDRKDSACASSAASVAPMSVVTTTTHKRTHRAMTGEQVEEEWDVEPDYTVPRGPLRRSGDAVDSDSDVDTSLTDLPMRRAAAQADIASIVADLTPPHLRPPPRLPPRSILLRPVLSAARAVAEPFDPVINLLIAKHLVRIPVFFAAPHAVMDTDVDRPTRDKGPERESKELLALGPATRVRFASDVKITPVPPLSFAPISHMVAADLRIVRACILAMPLINARLKYVRKAVRAVDKRLWRQHARSLPRPQTDDEKKDPFLGRYLSHDAFSEYLLKHSGGEQELSDHDTPALCDTIHYLNPRIMRQVIDIAQQRAEDRGDTLARRTLALRELLDGLNEQSKMSITSSAERNRLRHSLREEVNDPAYTKAVADRSKERMKNTAWLRDVTTDAKDDGRRELDEALKQLLSVATAVARANALLLPTRRGELDQLKDDIMKTLNAKKTILSDAAQDIKTPMDLASRKLCCEIQMQLFAQFPNLQDQAYHRVLSDSRSRAVTLLCGGDEKECHSRLEALGIHDDKIYHADTLTGQSLAFVLSLGHRQVKRLYDGFDFEDNPICYYADLECVNIVWTRVCQRLKHADMPSVARKRTQNIVNMCNRLNTSQGTQLDSKLLVVAPGASFADTLACLTRIQDALGELKAFASSMHSVFDMFDALGERTQKERGQRGAKKRAEEGTKLVLRLFGTVLVDPPVEDILTGQRPANPSRYELPPDSIATRWLEAEDLNDEEAEEAEVKADQMEVDETFEDTKLDAALRGDLGGAFPDSFELLRRADEESSAAAATTSNAVFDDSTTEGPHYKRMRVAKVAAAAALSLNAAVREEDIVAAFDADGDVEMT